jgi:hypothetical protein
MEEYQINQEKEFRGLDTTFEDTLQCFCAQAKGKGKVYRLTGADGVVVFEGQICEKYGADMLWSKLYGTSVSLMVVAINVVLKLVTVELV